MPGTTIIENLQDEEARRQNDELSARHKAEIELLEKELTDVEVDAILAAPDEPRFNSPEWKAKMWKKLQERIREEMHANGS